MQQLQRIRERERERGREGQRDRERGEERRGRDTLTDLFPRLTMTPAPSLEMYPRVQESRGTQTHSSSEIGHLSASS